MMNLDHADMLEAQGAFHSADYTRWLDQIDEIPETTTHEQTEEEKAAWQGN